MDETCDLMAVQLVVHPPLGCEAAMLCSELMLFCSQLQVLILLDFSDSRLYP